MNCLEFRKAIFIAPRSWTPEMMAHRGDCGSCAAFAAELDRMESALTEAIAVAPPEGLANRILLRRSLADAPVASVVSRRHFFALAASVATAAAGLGAYLVWRGGKRAEMDEGLARELIAHLLMAHPPGIGAENNEVTDRGVGELLKRASFASTAPLSLVQNGWPCEFRRQPIAHLLLSGTDSPVTALVLPVGLASSTQHFTGPNLYGVITPCAHGALALLAASDTELDRIAAHLRKVIITA
ncbi:MAG: DUF3379 family protein [Gammaproteobacteria bacterium]